MASNLRVDNIQPSVGMGIGIGTANGSVSFNADITGGMNVTTGSVGVGTDNPTEKLDINGGLKVYANTNIATFKNNQLRSDAAGAYYFDHGTTGQSFTFRTSTSSSLDTTGPSVTSAGNISFPSGKGIDFSATANTSESGATTSSELFDDYEEGSWTPDVSGGGVPWGNQTGSYVKIGKQVTAQFWLQASGASSSSGGFSIVGLPFASGSYSDRNAGACRAYSLANFSGASGVIYWMGGTSTSIAIVSVDGNGLTSAASLDHNVWQNGSEIHCTIHYQTA